MAVQHQEFKYRSVYLSDLKSIINLYSENNGAQNTVHHAKSKLTNDFGLPLSIAELNQKIIAYSSVHIDKSGKAAIKICTNNESGNTQFIEQLEHFTKNKFHENWGKNQDTISEQQIKQAIENLISWLNLCD